MLAGVVRGAYNGGQLARHVKAVATVNGVTTVPSE